MTYLPRNLSLHRHAFRFDDLFIGVFEIFIGVFQILIEPGVLDCSSSLAGKDLKEIQNVRLFYSLYGLAVNVDNPDGLLGSTKGTADNGLQYKIQNALTTLKTPVAERVLDAE